MEAFPNEAPARAPTLEEDPALGLSHREKLEILFAVMLGLFLPMLAVLGYLIIAVYNLIPIRGVRRRKTAA